MSRENASNRHPKLIPAVILCLFGILLLSGLSLILQRSILTGSMEKTLVNTVFALKEIVIDDDAAGRIMSGNTNAPAYRFYQEKLRNFVRESDFAVAGIATFHAHEAHLLQAGPDDAGHVLADGAWPDILLEHLTQKQDSAATDGQPIIFPLRIAERVHLHVAVSSTEIRDGVVLAYFAGELTDSVSEKMFGCLLLEAATALFFIIMLAALISICIGTQKDSIADLNIRNNKLSQDMETLHIREKKLLDLIHDNERFNAVTIGREERIIQLKAEVNSLLAKMHREKRYHVDKID